MTERLNIYLTTLKNVMIVTCTDLHQRGSKVLLKLKPACASVGTAHT